MDTVLLNILVCPICKGNLEYDKQNQELICHFDKLAYAIKDGMPNMIPNQARNIQN